MKPKKIQLISKIWKLNKQNNLMKKNKNSNQKYIMLKKNYVIYRFKY